mgnify:CR=1 FL=1
MDINATLLGHVIWFGFFIWITMKYIWPPLQKAMQDRQDEIAEGLAAAEKGRKDLEQAAKHSETVISEAKVSASDIVSQAEKRGMEVLEQAKEKAQVEHDRIVEAAKEDIAQEITRAKEELRSQISMLAVAGAEKILRKEVDKSVHEKLLRDLEKEFS